MGTDSGAAVVRYGRRSRLLHTAFLVTTFALLATGWWLATGHEGRRGILARLARTADTELHRRLGWMLVALSVIAVTAGLRGAITFATETFRLDRGDGRWFVRWPVGALTGRFAPHHGHFDPGQRLANLAFVIVIVLVTLAASGIAMTTLHGGPAFVWTVRTHRYAAYVVTGLVTAHVFLALGALPGYRGAWRSMHLRGAVPAATARRLWPDAAPTAQPSAARGDRNADGG